MNDEDIKNLIQEALKANNEQWEAKLKVSEDIKPAEAQLKANAEAKAKEDELNYRASQLAKYTILQEKYSNDHPKIFELVEKLRKKDESEFYGEIDGIEVEILKVLMNSDKISDKIKDRYKNGLVRTMKDLEYFKTEEASDLAKQDEETKKQDKASNRVVNGLPSKPIEEMTKEDKVAYYRATYAENARKERQKVL